jgi:AraC-like DNA-binding protein
MVFIVFAGLAIAALVVLLLTAYGIRVQRNNIWLICYLVALGYSCWISYLMQTREIYHFPHLIRTGTVFGYLVVPFLFLYVRGTCYQGEIWKPWYTIVFIPSCIFIIDLIPFWTAPSEDKIRLFESSMNSLQALHAFSESWFLPRGFHFIFRILWSLAWFAAAMVLMYKNRNIAVAPVNPVNKTIYRFMFGLSMLSLPFMLIHLVMVFFFRDVYTLSNFTFLLALPLFMIGGYLMFFPQVVYGLQLPKQENEIPVTSVSEQSVPSKLVPQASHTTSSEEEQHTYLAYKEQLLNFMEKEKPFLNQGLTIHQLADASGIPTYIISLLLNRHIGQSFNSWLNGYRVNTFKQILLQSNSRSFTLESLGKSAGFGSRVTLIKAFKKETGQTPGQFLRHTGVTTWQEIE